MTVQNMPTPDTTKDLIDPLDTSTNKSGFQRAHIVGDKFSEAPSLRWFRWILGGLNGQNSNVNGVLAPQSQRGGAILGVAVHRFEHVTEFNNLFFDSDPLTRDLSNKWMNVVRRDLLDDLQMATGNPDFNIDDWDHLNALDKSDPTIKGIFDQYNKRVGAFLDTTKILFMHEDQLRKLGYGDLDSLALNEQDFRFEDRDAVSRHLQDLDAKGLLGSGLIRATM